MDAAYEEIIEVNRAEGVDTPKVEFTYRFDIPSYFARFDFINAAKFAEHCGINATLLRRYISGKANASKEQAEKIRKALNEITTELSASSI